MREALTVGLAALIALSCRVPDADPPQQPRLTEITVSALAPDELRREARRFDRGVIPGTADGGESTMIPLVAPPGREIGLVAWWSDEPAAPLRIRAAPPAGGEPILAIVARDGGDPTPSFRAAAWGALAAASRAIGAELGTLTFAIEGPASTPAPAEAALSAGLLAAATGRDLRPDTAVLGAVAIDGTLLPSDDVAALAAAARERGAAAVGVPPGASADPDAEIIGDLAAAAGLLTAEPVPVPAAMSPEKLALSPSEARLVAAAYRDVRTRLAASWPRVAVLANQAPLPEPLSELVDRAERDARLAEEAIARGEVVAAYAWGRSAAVAAGAATATWSVVEAIREGELDRAREVFAAHPGVEAEALALVEGAPDEPPALAPTLRRLESRATALRAAALARAAADASAAALAYAEEGSALPEADRRSRAMTDGATRAALPATIAAARAAEELAAARLAPRLGDGESPPLRAIPEALDRLAASLRAAGGAKLAAGGGGATGFSPLEVSARYARARAGASPRLAAAHVLYTDGWIASDESAILGVSRRAETGAVLVAPSPQLVASLLERADDAARRHARAAHIATGAIPAAARLAYREARGLSAGDDRDRLRALRAYWRASAIAQLAVSVTLR